MTALSVPAAIDWAAAVFARNGCEADVARSVARALVMAEADGLGGHGLSRIPSYLGMLRGGKIDGRARPSATRPRPGVLAVDRDVRAAAGRAAPGHRDVRGGGRRAGGCGRLLTGVAAVPLARTAGAGAVVHRARRVVGRVLVAAAPGQRQPPGQQEDGQRTHPAAARRRSRAKPPPAAASAAPEPPSTHSVVPPP